MLKMKNNENKFEGVTEVDSGKGEVWGKKEVPRKYAGLKNNLRLIALL